LNVHRSAVIVTIAFAFMSAHADTKAWLDGTMLKLEAMDFEFARSESDIPFLPVLSLGYKVYGKTDFVREEGGGGDAVSFRTQTASGYAMVPLYIGRRGMALAVPYAGVTRFNFSRGAVEDEQVTSVYLPLGAAWQTEKGNQWGGFVMPAAYSPLSDSGDWVWSGMGGILGRHLSGERLVWYYGAVYDHAFSDGYILPYLGFTYLYDPAWSFSILAPWPAVSYAPSDRFFLRAGAAPSGASWAVRQKGDDQQAISSFGGWDLGLWANWRIGPAAWLAVGSGFSGLRSLEIDTDGDVAFDQSLESEPWISLSFSVRPP
jgi:hypothetical protein